MKAKTIAIAALGAVGLSLLHPAYAPTAAVRAQGTSNAPCRFAPPIITYETRNFFIYICSAAGELRYIGTNKTTHQSISLPAQRTETGYRATNGDFAYLIDRQDLLVLQNNLLFSREPVLQAWQSGGAPTAQTGVLRANDPGTQINLRAYPDPNARNLGYGLVGDRVTILTQAIGPDRYTWYQVRFPQSNAVGWIRGDLIRVQAAR